MLTQELITITLFFAISFFVITSVGIAFFVNKIPLKIEDLGASAMIGLGILANILFVLGLAGKFSKANILLLVGVVFAISLFKSVKIMKRSWPKFIRSIKKNLSNYLVWLFVLPIVSILGSLYLSSMQPPYTSDELHYHLPQAMQIVNSQKINFDFGGHYFYGNIPKLMEVIFAIGIKLSGFAFAHLLNFTIFVSFLLILYGLVKKHYGRLASLSTVLLVLLFDDFTWNATSGYIDSATVAYEIGSLLFFLTWLKFKNSKTLLISGALMGISLSIKYSPLYTTLFIAIIFFIHIFREKKTKYIKYFLMPSIVFAGYWYLKNLILYNNPFYPLYFGHSGVSELQYKSLIDAIQEFSPKTLDKFFSLIGHYKTLNGIFVYVSFFIPLFVPFIKKRKWPDVLLFIYFISYCFYWFFFATHQIRFLTPAIIIGIILTSRFLATIKLRYYFLSLITLILIFVFTGNGRVLISYKNNLINTKLHLTERQYGLGNITKSEFLTRHFGCQYLVIKYLEDNNLQGDVIDNWSVWFAPSVSFYSQNNNFITYGISKGQTLEDAIHSVKESGVKYIYFNSDVRSKHHASTDPIVVASKNEKLPLEIDLLEYSKLVFESGSCRLYYIDF